MSKNNYKKFPFFHHKIKTRTYIKNLRHCSLHLDIINNWYKFQISIQLEGEYSH